jgi:hypothetical protein
MDDTTNDLETYTPLLNTHIHYNASNHRPNDGLCETLQFRPTVLLRTPFRSLIK